MKMIRIFLLMILLTSCSTTTNSDQSLILNDNLPGETLNESSAQQNEILETSIGRTKVSPTEVTETLDSNIQTTSTVSTQIQMFPEVEIILSGRRAIDDLVLYRMNLPCWGDNFQCDLEPVNIFSRNDLKALGYGISPDGTRMVFMSDYLKEFRSTDLLIYIFENQSLMRLTDTDINEYMPSWSPSGNYIAYQIDEGGSTKTQIISDYGSIQMIIPSNHLRVYSPVWSNDAKKIAYYANDGVDTPDLLYYYDYETHQSVQLPASYLNDIYHVVWAPDDSKIIYIARHADTPDICIVEIDSLENYCLTNTEYWEYYPAWSPDGMRIVYSVLDEPGGYSAIWVMDSDGTGKKLVSQSTGVYSRPAWILDSNFIICSKKINGVWQPVILSVDEDIEIRLGTTDFDLAWEWIEQE